MSAVNEYKRILPMDSLKYTSLARKEIVELGLKLNLFPLDKAISEFERLRYAWGERSFKLELLDGLADMYIRKKDFANALRTLQELKTMPATKTNLPLKTAWSAFLKTSTFVTKQITCRH